jgi:hypothetical protein
MLGAREFAKARQPAVRRVGTSGVSLGTRKEDSDAASQARHLETLTTEGARLPAADLETVSRRLGTAIQLRSPGISRFGSV